jgi:hypothetical protein
MIVTKDQKIKELEGLVKYLDNHIWECKHTLEIGIQHKDGLNEVALISLMGCVAIRLERIGLLSESYEVIYEEKK